jgi:hypothetical protein
MVRALIWRRTMQIKSMGPITFEEAALAACAHATTSMPLSS